MAIRPECLDADHWVVATGDGKLIDLKAGIVRPALPDDYLTKCLGTTFKPDATCPTWERFLQEIMNNNAEMIAFIQRAVGHILTGDTSEQCLFFLWGTGANGKSTFLDTLLQLLGDYGKQCAPDTLMVKGQQSIRNDIARLEGARLITTTEAEDGQWIAEALIKQMTGGDVIVARKLYQEHFEFRMIGKICLATNHKPRVRGTDYAIWRRIHLIPFNITFLPENQDKRLKEKLLAELPGVLNWALQGCAEWQKGGLRPPEAVIAATEEYRTEMDVLGMWIKQNCEEGDTYKELTSSLYDNYSLWCKESGTRQMSRHEFSRRMQDRGYRKKETTDRTTGQKGRFLCEIKLSPKQLPLTPEERKFAAKQRTR